MYYPTNEDLQRMDSFVEEMSYYFKKTFGQYDCSLVRNVVYIRSHSSNEESTGLVIYQDWNGYFYSVNFGHCVMCGNGVYMPQQINEDQAIQMMIEFDELAFH